MFHIGAVGPFCFGNRVHHGQAQDLWVDVEHAAILTGHNRVQRAIWCKHFIYMATLWKRLINLEASFYLQNLCHVRFLASH